ncbi:hypothetical protein [Chryseobacterium gallinarum]|uniref:Fe2OG dioxygenase domain-containing protein n=1 Tax=Chryseobacterium gallinarum TaxID=1324352 RepID=A0ABX6KRA4_CHRGL|nr:hypothetical protein [Chryseobacterium gallinarum]QIY90738.1 hypothetical protein FOB44_08675 [Chryseobacterium gallinarum]
MKKIELEGKMYPTENFVIKEDFRTADVKIINSMLNGDGPPVYVIRGYMATEVVDEIKAQFYKLIEETGGGNRSDFVKTFQIGANQFLKSSSEYFDECNATRKNVHQLLKNIDHDIADDFLLEKTFVKYFTGEGVHFGPSYYRGNYSNLFTARLWADEDENKKLSLQAHEDLSQVKFVEKEGFEISNVKNVIACNLCVNSDSQSKLVLWNMSPSEAVKKELGLDQSGYPYPAELVHEIECLKLDTKPGDLYFINANFLHGVERSSTKNIRITLGRFMGYSSGARIAYWT